MAPLLPSPVRLQRFIRQYGACDDCGTLPVDVDDADTGQLCARHRKAWDDLDTYDQGSLVCIGLVHQETGALEADPDTLRTHLEAVPPLQDPDA